MLGLPEPLEIINRRLIEKWGKFSDTDKAIWRVVWSETELEKRWITHTKDGFQLLNPEVAEVPKYRQWIQEKYILERIIAIPEFVENDLVEQISYEPVWVFEDKTGNPLPPIWLAIEVIINQVYKAASASVGAKYKDPELFDKKDSEEAKKAKVDRLVTELFGNETDAGDALAHGDGVGFTTSNILTEETKNAE